MNSIKLNKNDKWVLNRLILNNPDEFFEKKQQLKENLIKLDSKYRNNLRYQIELAEISKVNIDLLTRAILNNTEPPLDRINRKTQKRPEKSSIWTQISLNGHKTEMSSL